MALYIVKPAAKKAGNSNATSNLEIKIELLFDQLAKLYGTSKLILKASKLDAVELMNSSRLEEKVLALQKLLQEDPTLEKLPEAEELPEIIARLEELTIDRYARQAIEDQLQKRIQERMDDRYNDYVQEIKLQTLKEINRSPENAQTLKKLGQLEKMEHTGLNRSALDLLRPEQLDEIVGQEKAIRTLLAELSSPYPQHILLYGPPGVGKTTCARLALAMAKQQGGIFKDEAPFVEVDGTTLRWDPRESTNPLLGSVHDPIYQGAKKELADEGIPEPKLGLVSEAHGGILFIDEIGEMEPLLQNKLLKVLEDKRVYFESSYYNPHDERVPQYIKQIFDQGIPADFILIGATTRNPEDINPAFRSRCMEVFFEPLTPDQIETIVWQSAQKLNLQLEEGAARIISNYTSDGRGANKILIMAYDLARHEVSPGDSPAVKVGCEKVLEAVQNSRILSQHVIKAGSGWEEGKLFGVGARGYQGTLIEIEAICFPAGDGEGHIRFNDTAGSMAKDSVFNAASVFRKEFNENLNNYDLHINIVGGGKVDGPSAGAAIYLAILSAVKHWPVRQDVAVTGELSIQGKVKPVGAIHEKIYGARQAGIKKIIVPADNLKDIPQRLRQDIEVVPVRNIYEARQHIFVF